VRNARQGGSVAPAKVEVQLERTIPVGRGTPAESFLRHRGLIALAAGGALVQACLLTLLAPAARPLAPQITALPPLAIFHDLRWLFGYNRSWVMFAPTYAALVLARAAVCTVAIRLAWPYRLARPAWSATFGRCVFFTLIASVLLSPVVTLLFGVSLLPFSWPYLAALPAMLLILIPLSHGSLLGSWWRTLPPARAVAWLLVSFIVLSAAAAAIGSLGALAAVAVSGLAGLVNARAWYGVALAVTREPGQGRLHWARSWRHHPGWPAPVSPVAGAAALALLIGATRLAFVLYGHVPLADPAPDLARSQAMVTNPAKSGGHAAANSRQLGAAVLIIPGFGSSCCGPSASARQLGPAALVRPFSYAGLDRQGRPLPYGLDATNLPISVLGDRIAAQVLELHKQTGRPVDIVAESEGTLGVYAMLARHPHVPVDSIALLSPIVDPGQDNEVGQDKEAAGQAVAAADSDGDPVSGEALSALVRVAGALSPFGESGAQRLVDSVSADGAAFAARAARNGQRIRWLAVVPLADAVTLPVCDLPSNVIVVPALHGSLIGNSSVERSVHRFFSDQQVAGPQQMRDEAEVIAAAAAAWRMPVIGAPSIACSK
jgi:hypothetical protein